MTDEEAKEFIELKKRYLQALDYESSRYLQDTPEGKKWAEKTVLQIVNRMCELWELMSEEEKMKHKELF